MKLIKVAVAGASGRMGQEVVRMVLADPGLKLVAAISRMKENTDIGLYVGMDACGVYIRNDLELALVESQPDVMVDFTTPQSVISNAKMAIRNKVRPIIGTTGYSLQDISDLDMLCRAAGIGGIIAPSFSIGAILMMKFAAQAAQYMPHVEIIEYHGDQKLDAPSGTSINTAELISQARKELHQGNRAEEEMIEGSRGGYYNGFRLHSVRLPGIFAQQEIIFGGNGQTLKLRHDSYDRAGYMPGVNIAIKKVMEFNGVVYGFENFID